MADVATLGLAVDSTQVKAATGDLNKLTAASNSAEQAQQRIKTASGQLGVTFKTVQKMADKAGVSFDEMRRRLEGTTVAHSKMNAASLTAVKGMQQLSQQATKSANDNKGLGEQTEKTTGTLEKFATRVARGVIAGAAIAAVQQLTKYLFELNAQLAATADTAQRVGIGGQQFQGLQTAAGYKGIAGSDFSSAMMAFNQQVDLARNGLGALQTLLRSNGKTVSDTATTFGVVADLVKNAGSEAQKFSILQQAGLPATREFAKLMEQGAGSLDKAAAASTKVTDQQLAEAQRINDKWNEIWTNFENWGKRAVVNVFAAMSGGQSQAPFRVIINGGTQEPKPSKPTFDPELAKQQISLEQQRIGLLGPLATVEDQVRAKQLEINAATLNNVGISKSQAAALLDITRAQAEMTRVQQQAQIGVFSLADAQKAANDNLKALVDQKLLDPNNPAQWAAATNAAAKSVENLANSAKVAGAPLEQLQRLQNEAGSARTQIDQFATTSLNSLSDNLVNIANGSQSAAEGFRNFGLAVVTALEKMIIQMLIIAPLAKSLQGFFGFGLFSDGGYVDPGSSSNPLADLTAADYGVGFASGGYTGAGGKYAPAGIVHRGEYVFDAASTSRIGVGNLERIRRSLPGFADGGYAGNVVAIPGTGQDNQPISFTYAPTIDARGADAQAVARLTSAFAKSQKDFDQNVKGVMIKYRANTPGSNR